MWVTRCSWYRALADPALPRASGWVRVSQMRKTPPWNTHTVACMGGEGEPEATFPLSKRTVLHLHNRHGRHPPSISRGFFVTVLQNLGTLHRRRSDEPTGRGRRSGQAVGAAGAFA